MAKKKTPGVPNRHLYTRISFLYQAATYLATAGKQETEPASESTSASAEVTCMEHNGDDDGQDTVQCGKTAIAAQKNMSRKMLTDLRAVTLKSQIRISPDIKRTICKHCDTLLIDGQTCSSVVENRSKGGKKPWADVFVIKCHTCGREKRFPVSAHRQKRRPLRGPTDPARPEQEEVPAMHPEEQQSGA